MEIEFQGQHTKESLFRAVKLGNKPSKLNAVFRWVLGAFLLGAFVIYFISIFYKEALSSFEFLRAGRHLITIPFLLYFIFQPYISIYQITNALWKNPGIQKPLAGTISSQGIAYISSQNTRRETTWGSFAKKQITDDLIVLVTVDGVLHFFPRHFFKDDNSWKIVLQWINSKVVDAS